MKIWHFYLIKSPLLLIAYVYGTQDVAFLYAALLSFTIMPVFAYFGE
jgi:hypothetical protein